MVRQKGAEVGEWWGWGGGRGQEGGVGGRGQEDRDYERGKERGKYTTLVDIQNQATVTR